MKNVILLLLITLALISCSKESYLIENAINEEYVIVLKERNFSCPWIPMERTKVDRNLSFKSNMTFDDCLGCGYRDDFFPVGNINNVTYSVIDIKKVLANTSYVKSRSLNEGDAKSFAYSSFDRYTENSSVTKKIGGGFSFSLGLFSIGAKKKMTEIFTQSLIEEQKRVFGELDVIYRSSRYIMQMSSRIRKELVLNYLSGDFKKELYETTPSELFYNYGGFVLSDFITGGRAVAVYTGLYNSNETAQVKEKDVTTDIEASYGFKLNDDSGSVSGNLGFGKAYSDGKTTSNKITSFTMSVKTIGGAPEFSSFLTPQGIDNVNINLSSWLSSLNDAKKHSIIDVSDNGLLPLTDFIMEENLKMGFSNFYDGRPSGVQAWQEPYINIYLARIQGSTAIVKTSLVTRFNDEILLNIKYIAMGAVNGYIQQEMERVSNIWGVKIISDANKKYSVTVNLDGIDETKMTKYIDSINNTTYLLYSANGKKYGYSIHMDRLLNDYVIKKYVDGLQSVIIDPDNLFDYKIVAL